MASEYWEVVVESLWTRHSDLVDEVQTTSQCAQYIKQS